jgi:toxin ParE1/3/4
MNTYEIRLTKEAEKDLRDIFKYISVNLQAVSAAADQLGRLENAIYNLEQMPERFHCYEKEPWHSRNLRIMPADNYLIFYIPNRENLTVTVLRIMYSARNVDKELKKIL